MSRDDDCHEQVGPAFSEALRRALRGRQRPRSLRGSVAWSATLVMGAWLVVLAAAVIEQPFRFAPRFTASSRRGLLLWGAATTVGLVAAMGAAARG